MTGGQERPRTLFRVATAAVVGVAVMLLGLVACSGPGNQNVPPQAPTDVSANPIPGGVRVVWVDQSTNEAEFIVFRSTADGEDEALAELARVPTDGAKYEDLAVDMGSAYTYAVAATNQFGTSDLVRQQPADPVSPGVGVRLTVTLDGAGTVDVLNGGQTVTCTSRCVVGLAQGTSVTLTAKGAEGLVFAGWAGACSMAGPCTFTIEGDSAVEARFSKHVLVLKAGGDSPVDVVASPTDEFGQSECSLDSGGSCAFGYSFDAALKVSVNSTLVEAQAVFGGYGGACTDPVGRYCLIDVNGETTVTITVVRVPVAEAKSYQGREDTPLSVGAGDGLLVGVLDTPGDSHQPVVVSGPASGSLDVAPDGSFEYQPAEHVNGQVSFEFAVRDAHGNESTPRTATIDLAVVNDAPRFDLAGDPPATFGNGSPVSRANFATGVHPGGGADEAGQTLGFAIVRTAGPADLLSAGPTLTIAGASATLTYTPAVGKVGTATYEVRLADDGGTANGGSDTSATQTFTITVAPVTLTATVTGGTGGGTIGRSPVGVANGPNQFDYPWGTSVTLTASPASGSQFVGWGGACAGVGSQTCVLGLTASSAVSAEFVAVHELVIGFIGFEANISISSDPTGIDACTWFNRQSNACNAIYVHDTVVTLTSGSTIHWSAPCPSGATTTCQLTMTAATDITVSSSPSSP